MSDTEHTPTSAMHQNVDIDQPENELPPMRLEDLPDDIRAAMERAGWNDLTPVQSASLPYLLAGRELMVQSRTGSGKTGAFVMPILHRLDPELAACQALVLVPTRELARQVAAEAEVLSGGTARVAAAYGGVGYGPQVDAFKAGAQIVVGTPGRILDHLLKRNLTLDKLKNLVFDEADRMLSIGFYPDMVQVKRYLPKHPVDTLMFSATYPPFVLRLAGEFMRDAQMLSLSGKQVHVAEVQHAYYEVPRMGRERALMRILDVENPASAMLFCNTKAQVEFVSQVLGNFGYDADGLTGDLSQAKREAILGRVRQGKLRFLVCTDVAARGIDIPDLSHVIMYEPPEDPESYIHRAGRTGRAGASGEVITLVDMIQKMEFQRLAQRYEVELEPRDLPSDEDVQRVVAERLTALLEAELRSRSPLVKERLRRFVPLARELAAEGDDGLTVIAMLLDDQYQASLHAKPELPAEQRERKAPVRPRKPVARSDSGAQIDTDDKPKRKRRRRPKRKKKPATDE